MQNRLNQKMIWKLFDFLHHFYSYFWGIPLKLGGRWGHMVFWDLTENQIFDDFSMRIFPISKISFLVNYYQPRPYRSTIQKISIPQTQGSIKSCVNVVKSHIFRSKTWIGYRDPGFGPRAKLYMAGCTPGWVVLILIPNRKWAPKNSWTVLSILRDHIS